jgi:signal transduction histidine kinase/CheY-like chemotaxis protein
MWSHLKLVPEPGDRELRVWAKDLSETTFRNLVILIGLAYLVIQLIMVASNPPAYLVPFAPLTGLMLCAAGLGLWLLPRRLRLAQAAWQIGMLAAVLLALFTFHRPEVSFLLILLPFMAMVTAGSTAAVVSAVLVSMIGLVLANLGALPMPYAPAILCGGLLALLIGWTSTNSLLTATQWSILSYQQGRQHVEEARQQRVELKVVQEDLLHANHELARLTQRLEVLKGEAEEARRVKENFVANISHELRTPLNMIIGFCDMISQSPQAYGDRLPPMLMADIAIIRRNSQQLADLVNDVLDLSFVESGRMALSKEPAVLQRIVAEAVEAVRPLYESKGLYLDVQAPDQPAPVLCDPARIRGVLLNLLSNAGRFTNQGGVRVNMVLQAPEVTVSIADSGPGITASDQTKLFHAFEQLDPSIRRQYGGSGLGLVISRQFVELHGGHMWLESQVGVGTTFFFSLPLEMQSAVPPAETRVQRWFNQYQTYEARSRPWRLPPSVVAARYVVVDQELRLAPLLRRYLDNAEIVVVGDLPTALAALEHSPAQALIVNQREVPADWAGHIPLATPLVTCWAPGISAAQHELSVVRYLVKPINRQDLLEALEAFGERVHSVLLSDDHPDAQQLFTRMLTSSPRKYAVYHAVNGYQALELLRERKPDLLLLDLVMPDLDGLGVLRAKSQDPTIRDIPVIVISATDPSNTPVIMEALTVRRSQGLTTADFLACLQALSVALLPERPQADSAIASNPTG